MTDMVRNPGDRFSRDKAPLILSRDNFLSFDLWPHSLLIKDLVMTYATAILAFPMIQERHLTGHGERMCN